MSTITREFTKEQLIARIHQVTAINKYRISRDPDADGLAMDNELFAIAMVALETGESEMLKRLAIILSGSDAPGEIRSLTVTAQSFVDRCKVLAKERDECRMAMLQGKAEPRDHVRREHAEWSQSTFGDVGPVGPLKHLSKEALEAAAEPEDLSEWADMQFLLWDAQRRAGITDEQITLAMIEKLAVNKTRQWPEPKDGEPRLHIKSTPHREDV